MAMFRWPVGWDVFENLRSMQHDMERLFGRGLFSETRGIGGGSYPSINVLNGPEQMIVECELPGVKREDIELSITGETLVIKGTKQAPQDDEKRKYTRRERGFGQFSRTVILPEAVDAERVSATMADGVLTVSLPKSEAAKPKQITVN